MIRTSGAVRFWKKGSSSYQLAEPWWVETGLKDWAARLEFGGRLFLTLTAGGRLVVEPGYWWDGPSGPTIDTEDFMPGSLLHDGLYQLAREGKIPPSLRDDADGLLYRLCRQDGMPWWRAKYVRWAVRRFAMSAYAYSPEKVYEAGRAA